MAGVPDHPDSGHIHDRAHGSFRLVRHQRGDWRLWLGRQVPVDVIVIDEAHRDLALRHRLHDLGALAVHLGPRVGLQTLEELTGALLPVDRLDDRNSGLEIFAAGVGDRDLVFPAWIGQVQDRLHLFRFHQRGVVRDDPEPPR
ncbi:MAG: hypothetical protein AUH21_02850 [Nitrospirae bacterium 13_2_20CM_62_7]|nr:MAG: hypothetical protein AUH21_02850 [Nitrospirae bacterium 13_2_20CM_62_7]